MIRRRYVLMVCACLWSVVGWPGSAAWAHGQAGSDAIQTVQLTLAPAPEPEYALQVRLDTPAFDRRPGNGALLYETAASVLGEIDEDWRKVQDQIQKWYEVKPATLPVDQVRAQVSRFDAAIHYLDLAGRSEECVWNYPIREEGLRCLVPDMPGYRTLLRVLALKTRLSAIRGDIPGALETVRIGLNMARDMGSGPTITQAVSGLGMARGMLAEVGGLIQRPDVPNLYWALTALPRPLIDARKAMEMDAAMVYAEVPQLRDIETRAMSEAELTAIWSRVQSLAGGSPQDHVPASLVASTMRFYPQAKAELERGGKTPEEIAAMSASQVVLIYRFRQYRRMLDAACKWSYVPVWQVGDRYRKAEQEFFSGKRLDEEGPLANALWAVFPHFGGFPTLLARLERDVAMLRCVEALRIYAAAHHGALPRSLDEVTEVPVPMDPLHGRGFQYRLEGDKAMLESPVPAGGTRWDGLRYEIVLRPTIDRGPASR